MLCQLGDQWWLQGNHAGYEIIQKKNTHQFAVQVCEEGVVWQFFRSLDIQVMISFSFSSWFFEVVI